MNLFRTKSIEQLQTAAATSGMVKSLGALDLVLLGIYAADEEGLQIMRNLGRNMAWMLKCIEAGKAAGIEAPTAETAARTNFIR